MIAVIAFHTTTDDGTRIWARPEEYEPVLLSMYSFAFESDGKRFRGVSNRRLADTPFRSPQLSLFELAPDEWLL